MIIGEKFNPYKIFHGVFIPNCVMRYRGLTPSEKLLWGRLAQYAGKDGNCHPSYEKLAYEISIGRRQIIRMINKLIQKKFIIKTLRYCLDDNGKALQTTNHFSFLWHEIFDERDITALGGGAETINPSGLEDTLVVVSMSPKENHIRESYKEIYYKGGDILLQYLNEKRKEKLGLIHPFRKIHKHLMARLKEGHTVEDCKRIIDWKIHEWGKDSKMQDYINLETLFRPEHFDRYLSEAHNHHDRILKEEYQEYVDRQWDKIKEGLKNVRTSEEEKVVRSQHKPFPFERWLNAKQNMEG